MTEWLKPRNAFDLDLVCETETFDPFDAYEGSDLDRYKFEIGGW